MEQQVSRLESVKVELYDYFKVLEDDKLLEKYCVTPNDIEFLANRILESIRVGDILAFEKQMVKEAETCD